jgi:hypothetical protein
MPRLSTPNRGSGGGGGGGVAAQRRKDGADRAAAFAAPSFWNTSDAGWYASDARCYATHACGRAGNRNADDGLFNLFGRRINGLP